MALKVTYTIQVCNESRELFSLLNFLIRVKDKEDNIHVVVDSLHTTNKVKLVLENFKDEITLYERPFDNFLDNSNFHIEKATGDYIFGLDADEMPQELLIKNFKHVIKKTNTDLICVPRINIHPGSTEEFIKNSGFHVNENGWINWPDYQGRIYKRSEKIKWSVESLHTKLVGFENAIQLNPNPSFAFWHIKSIEKQNSRWKDGNIQSPSDENIYDLLM